MRTSIRALAVLALAAVALAGTASWIRSEAAPPADRTTKEVRIYCPNGWRGSAGGSYGGVSFGIGCAFDRASVDLEGVEGTHYSIRMGVETLSGAVDCFFTGDAAHVQESCAAVRITIK